MLKILDTLISILLLRKSPQDLPNGMFWLLVFIFANYALNLYQLAIIKSLKTSSDMVVSGNFAASLDIILQVVLVVIVLQLAKRSARINQTLTALFGTGFLFALMVSPILQLSLSSDGKSGGGLLLALMAWSFAVKGNIYKHALSITMMAGVGLAVGLFFAAYFIALAFTTTQ
ncbi:MAG: hypothetical protein L3J22_08135 [Xanthomonadales bacterium]|nr:hypothetical protein [Xanthomonadales bacterium]